MSEIEQPSAALPLATIEAIVRAANARAALSPETKEALRGWLSDALAGAVRRAGGKRPSLANVDALDTAQKAFKIAIRKLQNCSDPPPSIPVDEGDRTAWDHWLDGARLDGFGRTRPYSCDWPFVVALLALYETVSGEAAFALTKDGPTMRYLQTAMAALAMHIPTGLERRLRSPQPAALHRRLPFLREVYFPDEVWILSQIFDSK